MRSYKRNLPSHVFLRNGQWYVRVHFPSTKKYANGRTNYIQVVRRCNPETPERAAQIVAALKSQAKEKKAQSKTLNGFLSDFLKIKKSAVSRRTIEHYQDIFNKYIKPYGQASIDEITPGQIQHLIDSVPLPDASKRVHHLLAMAFKQAVLWDILKVSPVRGIVKPKHRPKESVAMTLEETQRFLEVCRENPDYFLFEFCLELGLRPQELLALTWNDIDWTKKKVRVNKATQEGFKGGGIVIGTPKTQSSLRSVTFSTELKGRLAEHKARQESELTALRAELRKPLLLRHMRKRGVNYSKRRLRHAMLRETLKNHERFNLLFPSENGKPQSRVNLNRRQFKNALIKAGLDAGKYSIKSLRHTSASLLAEVVSPKRLQKRLGHSSPLVSLRYYIHVDDDEPLSETFAGIVKTGP